MGTLQYAAKGFLFLFIIIILICIFLSKYMPLSFEHEERHIKTPRYHIQFFLSIIVSCICVQIKIEI